jgi:hypothetical protein
VQINKTDEVVISVLSTAFKSSYFLLCKKIQLIRKNSNIVTSLEKQGEDRFSPVFSGQELVFGE